MRISLQQLLRDESGFVVSAELVLVSSIVVTGMIVGLVEVRDSMVYELNDVSLSIGSLNQSYSFGGLVGCRAIVPGSCFHDVADTGDNVDFCHINWDKDGVNSRQTCPDRGMGIIEIDSGDRSEELDAKEQQKAPADSAPPASEQAKPVESVI